MTYWLCVGGGGGAGGGGRLAALSAGELLSYLITPLGDKVQPPSPTPSPPIPELIRKKAENVSYITCASGT